MAQLVAVIEPFYPKGGNGRPPMPLETMLRIHFRQQWFGLSDRAMEESLVDIPAMRRFARLDAGEDVLPDESTILRFRHRREKNGLAQTLFAEVNALLTERGLMVRQGTIVDATLIAAPPSTKNETSQRDPERHPSKKGKQWYFGMKAHIGVDADSGLVPTVVGTSGNISDVSTAHALLHGEEVVAYGDAGYQCVEKRPEHIGTPVAWHTAMRPGKRRALSEDDAALK